MFVQWANIVRSRIDSWKDRECFVVEITGEELWDLYLFRFPEGTNPIFRQRTEHDCSCCRNFIKNLGRIVSFDSNGNLETVWDDQAPGFYEEVATALRQAVINSPIVSVYKTKELRYGATATYELIDGHSHTWNHFVAHTPSKAVVSRDKIGPETGRINTSAQMLQTALDTISLSAVIDVIDLIESQSLYRGDEHLAAVKAFRELKRKYTEVQMGSTTFSWKYVTHPQARIKNTVIGTLLEDLSAGVDTDRAVKSFETKVAPANYKRSSAPITPKMIELALKTVRDLGLESALERRHAVFTDLSVRDVLFVDSSIKMKDRLASLLTNEVVTQYNPKNVTEITSEEFFRDVVPFSTSISVLVEQSLLSNLVSLTAPVHSDAGRLFPWDNGFAWSYNGDVTDSIKERVKAAGGNINAKLRVSLSWFNHDDLDLHCLLPNRTEIYYGNKQSILDVDMNAGRGTTRTPVENMAFNHLQNGDYSVVVNQFSKRENIDFGFEIEVEYEGIVRNFSYSNPVVGRIPVINFNVNGNQVTWNPVIPEQNRTIEKWGVQTGKLVKVNSIINSPNHWETQVGNRHWFFILDGCQNPDGCRGIYNEFLRPELLQHRKVFEVLGRKTRVPFSENQLSGLGFSSTVRKEVVFVVTKNNSTRTYRVQF